MDQCYNKDDFPKVYVYTINLVPGLDGWHTMGNGTYALTIPKQQLGRPKKNKG